MGESLILSSCRFCGLSERPGKATSIPTIENDSLFQIT
jgi:hypothetical protein